MFACWANDWPNVQTQTAQHCAGLIHPKSFSFSFSSFTVPAPCDLSKTLQMSSNEVIQIEWEQLPQRSSWLSPKTKPETEVKPLPTPRNQPPGHAEKKPRLAKTPAAPQKGGWEYLDHTADVQIHSWGPTLSQAFGSAVVAMFAYMVELPEISDELEMDITAEGHDLHSLLYNFMDECLYIFHTESFAIKEVIIRSIDLNAFKITALAKGGLFDVNKHSQGTEVKAITYSNMQIITKEEKAEVFVIVDI